MSTLKLYRSFGLPSPKQEVAFKTKTFHLQSLGIRFWRVNQEKPSGTNTNSEHIVHSCTTDEYYVMVQKGLIFAG